MKHVKYLYMPIETKERELDSKLLITLEAISKGYVCLIGARSTYDKITKMPEGVFFHNSLGTEISHFFKRFTKHKIVIHDEEGLIQFNWKEYITRRVDHDNFKYADVFFCWGNEQKKYIDEVKSKHLSNIEVAAVGNPRIDLLQKKFRKYYNFKESNQKTILINTKLSACNYINLRTAYLVVEEKRTEGNKERYDFYKGYSEYCEKLFQEYKKLIYKLSYDFPECKIIIRPHPSENIQTWLDYCKSYDNIIVTRDESVGYWISQSDVIIHTGCTTAIEAFLMDKVAISFKPITNEKYNIKLPNDISLKSFSIDECNNMVRDILKNNFSFQKYKNNGNKFLKDYIAYSKEVSAFEQIVEGIDSLDVKQHSFNWISLLKIQSLFLISKIRFFMRKDKDFNKKFKSLDYEEVSSKITSLNKILNNKVGNIQIKELDKHSYLIWNK